MKRFYPILGIMIVLTILTFLFLTPQKNKNSSYKFSAIPELKQRNVMQIDPVEEWDNLNGKFGNLKKTLKENPDDAGAKLALIDIYMHESRVTGEENYYTEASLYLLDKILNEDLKKAEKNPKNDDLKFQALMMMAYVQSSQHHFKDALEFGKQAVAMNPNSSIAYGVMVDANVELGNYDEAIKMCETMMDLRPDLRSYSRASYLREIHGDVDGAIDIMKLAVSAGAPGDEQTAWCRVTLGKLYVNYGDLSNAEVQYSLALAERPNYVHATAGLARLEMKKSNFASAEKLFSQAINVAPSASVYEDLAMLYKQMGEKQKEKEAISQSQELMLKQHNHGSNTGLESAYLQLRMNEDYDAAWNCMNEESKMRPENIEVNKVLAWAAYGKGDLEKAVEHITKAMATNSQDPEMQCIAGLIKIKQGKEQEGKDLLAKAFQYNPYLSVELSEQAEKYVALK